MYGSSCPVIAYVTDEIQCERALSGRKTRTEIYSLFTVSF